MTLRFRFQTGRPAWRLVPLVVLVGVLVFVAACQGKATAGAKLYHCPMHPNYVSDRPGDCPICGMRLVPIEKTEGATGAAASAATPAVSKTTATEPVVYTCPMHPEIRRTKPGQCPICGMDLVPIKTGAEDGSHEHGVAAGAGNVSLSAEQVRLAGVQTTVARLGQLTTTIRTVGTVVADETRVREVTTKVAGFVEKLYVNAVGQDVRAGQPLFELYSPELLASQGEYLLARQTAASFQQSSLPEVRRGGQDLASAARRRLELFDVPAEFIERLEATGKAERRVAFRAPFPGVVTVKNVVEGQRVEPGMNLLTVSDLSRVWVVAQVYEAEASAARDGRTAVVTLPYDAAVRLVGRVTFVYPTLDTDSRTLRVRLEFANPGMALKPGMFVNVELATDQSRGVIVPDSAVIDSGTRQVVFVQGEEGQFAPREVHVAMRANGQAVITSGLADGARVAISANFLLDSESRLRTAIGAASKGK
jgi:Cu(I)/Ag(I) efflux system membrane fusion protein